MPKSLSFTQENKNTSESDIKIENLKYPPLDQDGFFYALLEKKSS